MGRSLWQQHQVDIALKAIELLPEVAQRIQDFHRVKIDDGRKVWEVSAKEARHFEDEGMVAVIEPVVAVFFEEGRTVSLRGNGGKVFIDGKDLSKVEVEGGIQVRIDPYSMRTEYAQYETETDRIVVPGEVSVESDQLEFDGRGMEIDLNEQRLEVKDGVEMLLWPKGRAHAG